MIGGFRSIRQNPELDLPDGLGEVRVAVELVGLAQQAFRRADGVEARLHLYW